MLHNNIALGGDNTPSKPFANALPAMSLPGKTL